MDVRVAYRVKTGPDRFAEEGDAEGADLPAGVTGQLVFSVDGAEAFVEDDFVALVAACFQAVTQLSSGPWFEGWLTSTPGEYRLTEDGDRLQLSGSAVLGPGNVATTLTAPREALLSALTACGRRGLALLHAVGTDPAVLDALDGLDAEATQARSGPPPDVT